MKCPGCNCDLVETEFPLLLKGDRSSKCWRCTNWRLHRKAKDCPSCGAQGTVTESEQTYEFEFKRVKLPVTHALLHCESCGESLPDGRGEEAREQAVSEYLAS